MTPEHRILREIGAHSRVNVGNFEEALAPTLRLLEEAQIIERVPVAGSDDTWYSLSGAGWAALFSLNSITGFGVPSPVWPEADDAVYS